ncbi:MAG: aminotransferase class IV, partial [Planctomycetota bacterium]
MKKENHPFILLGKDGIEDSSPEKLAYSSSLQYGFGLFETLRIKNGEIIFWHDHFWRMYNSTKYLGLPFYWNSSQLLEYVKNELIKDYDDGLLRLYLFLSPLYGYKNINNVESKMLCSLLLNKLEPVHNAKLYISNVCRYSKDELTRHKLTQRAHLILVTRQYQQKGAVEGLLLNENFFITE